MDSSLDVSLADFNFELDIENKFEYLHLDLYLPLNWSF